ncbi:hypothetical protein MXE97_22630 [Escherichia coli]|nr:hypothetical protein [Escherichia coli]
MKYDIVELITTMLNKAGIGDIIDSDLNNHSTISLNMKEDIPTIHIRNEDDEVWLWATIVENAPTSLAYCSASLIPLMMTYNEDYFYTGQPCLYPINGNLELRAQVKEKHLVNAKSFLLMLDSFLTVLQDYRSVLA